MNRHARRNVILRNCSTQWKQGLRRVQGIGNGLKSSQGIGNGLKLRKTVTLASIDNRANINKQISPPVRAEAISDLAENHTESLRLLTGFIGERNRCILQKQKQIFSQITIAILQSDTIRLSRRKRIAHSNNCFIQGEKTSSPASMPY